MARRYKGVLTPQETARKSVEELRALREEGYLPAIGGGALESNVLGLWVAKQTAKGSPVTMTAGTKKPRWVGGDLQTNRADGTEQWSDSTLFGDTVDYVNTLIGNGAPVLQGQSGIVAYLAWLASGQETVTGGTNAVQTVTITGAPTGGTFTLTFNGYTTAPIPSTATAAAVQAAILAATNANGQTLPAGSVTATGGPLPTTAVVVTFTGALAAQPVPLFTANAGGLTGGTSPAVTPTMTTVGVGFSHVATPNDAGGFWSTWVKSVGKTVNHRSQYNDCRVQSLRFEGSSASKVVKVTPTFLSLDPGQILAADPTQPDDGTRPFIYTEAVGTITIDGTVYRGASAFGMEATWGVDAWYGDDVQPYDVINTRANVSLTGITILLDALGIQRYNTQIYGVPTPATNAKPIHGLPNLGSYSIQFNRTSPYTGLTSESAKFELPSVKWNPDLNIPANPAGGPVEFPLAAEFRKITGQPAFRVTTVNADPAYTA